ncbi:MAG: putative nitrogen regulatory PII-like protein [Methanocorpusculum sp. MCE]|nr:MAG: putative nitrogen regulatory PII-like protein [Methanocorpusculum sp. MCE]
MYLVKAVVRPDKKDEILYELAGAGFHAETVVEVVGRGKQKGINLGGIVYDEIPKVMILVAIRDDDKRDVIDVILRHAKTGEKGAYGDGKIFISAIDEIYTVSSGKPGL